MTLIDFGDIKIRFDPKEVRISIDGDLIDIGGARSFISDPLVDVRADSLPTRSEMDEIIRKRKVTP